MNPVKVLLYIVVWISCTSLSAALCLALGLRINLGFFLGCLTGLYLSYRYFRT